MLLKRLKWITLFLMFATNVLAVPSGTDLLSVCEDSIANGFQSKVGMMCIWYVTPCDCNFSNEKNVPRVCLPKKISHEELAREVIAGLYEQPGLQSETAEMAIGLLLSPNYPCID